MSRKTAMKMGRPIADKITKAESVVVKTKKGTNTTGTFVCNHLMYGVLYTLAKKYPHIKGWIYTCSFHTCTGSKKNTGSSIYGTGGYKERT